MDFHWGHTNKSDLHFKYTSISVTASSASANPDGNHDDSDRDDDTSDTNEDDIYNSYNLCYEKSYASGDCYRLRSDRFERKHILVLCALVGDHLKERNPKLILKEVTDVVSVNAHSVCEDIMSKHDDNKAKFKDMLRNLQKGIVKHGDEKQSFQRMKYEGRQLLKGVSQDKLAVVIDRCLKNNEDYPSDD